MNNKKIVVSTIVIILAIILVLTLWKIPALVIVGIMVLTFLKHKYSPIRKELQMFLISAVIGSFGESLIILGGPWSYASVQVFNIPVWLPFLWGLAGITCITIYESLAK